MTLLRLLAAFFLIVVVAGCGAREPFVYLDAEFDRSRADFGRPVAERETVVVCYAASATTPDAVRGLAERACADVGKRAVYAGSGDPVCPLLTPAAAAFDCVAR